MALTLYRGGSVLALIAVGILLWAGCGSSEEQQSLAASSLTKAQFIEEADAICRHERLLGLRYQPADSDKSEADALAAAIDATVLPAVQSAIDKIYALGAPRPEQRQTEEFLVALQDGVNAAEDLEDPTLRAVETLLAPSGKLARKAKLESCIYG